MDEDAFLRTIAEEPASAAATWLVLADWLEERGDPRAELVRLCHDPRYQAGLAPGKRDERIRRLLASGVKPCVPTIINSVGMQLALIPAGTFLMGSPDSEKGRLAAEGPQHEVEITRPFYLGIHPVTQEQYKKVMGKRPSYYTSGGPSRGAPTHPVEQVSWKEAVAFCRKLSARAEEKSRGRTYRLPTEAEWEYACRGGATGSTPFYYGKSLTPTHANFATKAVTTPVGSYRPNAFGLYDMHGNVWEWCQDWYGENYYAQSPRRDPQGPQKGRSRVLRGGSWVNSRFFCRSAARGTFEPDRGDPDIGFRVVCIVAKS